MVFDKVKEHGNRICNKYVPHLDDRKTLEEIFRLPAADMITVASASGIALEKGLYPGISKEALMQREPKAVRYDANREELLAEIYQRIVYADHLWLLTDRNTSTVYFNDMGQVLFFTEKKYAEEAMSRYRKLVHPDVEISELTENIPVLVTVMIHMYGAKTIKVNECGFLPLVIDGTSMVTPNNLPTCNPEFYAAAAQYQQELHSSLHRPDRDVRLEKLKKKMDSAFRRSRFVVAGERTEDNRLSVPLYQRGEGENSVTVLPVFTDRYDSDNFFDGQYEPQAEWTIQDLMTVNFHYVVEINPSSLKVMYPVKEIIDIEIEER